MIYCIEDDANIRDLVVYALNAGGFRQSVLTTAFLSGLPVRTVRSADCTPVLPVRTVRSVNCTPEVPYDK